MPITNRAMAYSDKKILATMTLKDYTKVIELKPDDAQAYSNRGTYCLYS